jgi:hypothetical protein
MRMRSSRASLTRTPTTVYERLLGRSAKPARLRWFLAKSGRTACEPGAEAELGQAAQPRGIVHGQMEHDRGEEHQADHCAHPEALHAGRDQPASIMPMISAAMVAPGPAAPPGL